MTAPHPFWTTRRARWLMIAFHVPILAGPPYYTLIHLGEVGPTPYPALSVVASVAIIVLQLRHSLAVARNEQPRGWRWTLPALTAAVYLPILWLGWDFVNDWLSAQALVAASALMLLPLRAGIAVAATISIGSSIVVGAWSYGETDVSAGDLTFYVTYVLVVLVGITVGLYGSTRLVRALDELQSARAEMAELAVQRERLRVSRDLHDLLGQCLSAVSLKGDLAVRLLHRDMPAARAEIEGLADVARDALRGMRAITRNEHLVSLDSEAEGAAALLSAAGISVVVDLDVAGVSDPVAQMFAWAVREGVTNVLRHSAAHMCSITAERRNGKVRLEIVNDGVRTATDTGGTGLAGLTERAKSLSGSVVTTTDGGRFRLLVEIPEGMVP